MKKILVIAFLMVSSYGFSQSYSNAIGIRGTYYGGVTFKHMLGDSKGLEFIAASRYHGFNVTGLYEIHANAFDVEGLNWYYGAGAHIGHWNGKYWNNGNYKIDPVTGQIIYNDYTVIGIDGIVGIEYNISEIPINVSVDYKPAFNLVGYTGFWWDSGAISVRYYF